jgi:hypothetical protein
MILLTAVLLQSELLERERVERWGALLYELESARLAEEDVAAEVKNGADEKALRAFRAAADVEPRRLRVRELAKGLEGEPTLELARARFAEAKKAHAAALEKDVDARVRWIERQIKELYEPLVRLNAQGFAAVKGYQKLNADDADQVRWKVWAERSFLPRNEETRKLIAGAAGLLEGDGLSEPVIAFLAHQHSWALRHGRWLKEKGEYDWGSRTNWPVAFSMECERTYQVLLDRRARLVAGEK